MPKLRKLASILLVPYHIGGRHVADHILIYTVQVTMCLKNGIGLSHGKIMAIQIIG